MPSGIGRGMAVMVTDLIFMGLVGGENGRAARVLVMLPGGRVVPDALCGVSCAGFAY
jgi:hypothetical protein